MKMLKSGVLKTIRTYKNKIKRKLLKNFRTNWVTLYVESQFFNKKHLIDETVKLAVAFLWLLRVSEVVTIAIVSVFRKWVSNNRISLRANQHTKLAKVRTSRTLRWFPDSSRWRTKYSGFSWSVEPMSALKDSITSITWGESFFL